MRVVTAEEIDAALSFPALVDALADAFRGGILAPPRHHHTISRAGGDATLLLMPAWTEAQSGSSFAGVKVVTVYPDNGTVRLPSVLGTYLLLDGNTGQPLAALDGARLTLWRTAAASALAARHLARKDAASLLMVGAGALAPFLIRAHASQRPISEVRVWTRRPTAAAELAAGLSGPEAPVLAVEDLEGAVGRADIISCATLSTAPLVKGAWLKAGAHLDLVGAFNLSMREADDEALARASVHVDTPAARVEGGDVAVAIRAGSFSEDRIMGDLQDLVTGRVPGRISPDEITLFKSIGASLEDLAAAVLVWRCIEPAGGLNQPA